MQTLCELRSPGTTSANQQATKQVEPAINLQYTQDKTESEEEQEQHHQSSATARFAVNLPHLPASESCLKRSWQSRSRQLLLQRTRNQIDPLSQQQEPVLVYEGSSVGGEMAAAVEDVGAESPAVDDFAEEITRESVEIRTLMDQIAQLWAAIDQVKHVEDITCGPSQQFLERFSASARHRSLPAQIVCSESDNSTLGSNDEEYGEEDEDIEIESVNMVLQSMTRSGSYSTGDIQPSRSLVGQGGEEERENGMSSDGGHERERYGEDSEDTASESGGMQLEQGEDASYRAFNASKAHAIKNAMLQNLIRLGFREDITRAALEAGVLEIDHYDSDCELAYVDIFMSLMKMVCDAHVMSEGDDVEQSWTLHDENSGDNVQADITEANSPSSLEQHSLLPFKWPVFDMARFEFENARPGTCFNSVCVLTNLPQVSVNRTEELMEVLSCNVFCMIGDPIQVVIPSVSSTGRTKGHAFLEFDNPDMAQRCALAVDGLTWGTGPFGRIRGNLFRQYQVQSPAAADRWAPVISDDGASLSRSLSSGHGSSTLELDNREAERFRPYLGEAQQQTLLCGSEEDDNDTGEWPVRRSLEYAQFNLAPLLDLLPGSVGIREQYEPRQHDIAMQLSWDDEGEYLMKQRREGEGDGDDDDDDNDDDDNDESFDSNSVLEFQCLDEEKLMEHPNELVQEYLPNRVSSSSASSTVTSTAPAVARESHAGCGMAMPFWDVCEGNDVVEKPWRTYCEDLILRNREMQEQIAFARRRIVQLSHNNQKLHLLIDRVERDRDGLLFENNVLQTQVHGYEDHEQHHDSLMKELVSLRKRVTQQEHSFDGRTLDRLQQIKGACTVSNAASTFSYGVRAALSHIASVSFANCNIEELKEWEQQLENTLNHVRSIKEERALEMQKKLDRQVEEQNELKLCVICLSNEKSILCLPCRHLCLCKTCSHRQEVTKCPICRLEIEEVLAVYS